MIVCFTTNSARIFRKQVPYIGKWPNSFFEPDLSRVSGVLPQHWKIVGEEIHPMTEREIRYRDHLIEENGLDNRIRRLELADIVTDPDKLVFKKKIVLIQEEKEDDSPVSKTVDAKSIVMALELMSSDMFKFSYLQIGLMILLIVVLVINEVVGLL